jgi:hypothetical protein
MRPKEDRHGLASRRPLAAGGAASVAPFGATASMMRRGWPGLEGGGFARGAAALVLKVQQHGPVDGGTAQQSARRLSSRGGERRGKEGGLPLGVAATRDKDRAVRRMGYSWRPGTDSAAVNRGNAWSEGIGVV